VAGLAVDQRRSPLVLGFAGRAGALSLWCGPTLQPAHFGRVYAAYGGFFIVLSLLWGWIFDGNRPDRFDVIGATVSLIGVFIIMYWPR
jgi:drug/metabolite transporter superfamily protein YnfA